MITYAKTGTHHLNAGTACQDAVYFRDTPEFRFFAVADGASACENSALGAAVACRAAADYFLAYGNTLAECSDEKMAYLILDQVRFALEETAREHDIAPETMSSTLTFCCLKRQNMELLVFHLGDGAVYLLDGSTAEQVVKPFRCRNAPPLTMTVNAYKTVQIRRLSPAPQTRIFLCTDGLLKLMDTPEGKSVPELLACRDFEGLSELLDETRSFDDCSFLVC